MFLWFYENRLYGSYENLDAGQTYDALIDMSGGIQECIEIKKLDYTEKSKLWNIMLKAYQKDAILSCSINVIL